MSIIVAQKQKLDKLAKDADRYYDFADSVIQNSLIALGVTNMPIDEEIPRKGIFSYVSPTKTISRQEPFAFKAERSANNFSHYYYAGRNTLGSYYCFIEELVYSMISLDNPAPDLNCSDVREKIFQSLCEIIRNHHDAILEKLSNKERYTAPKIPNLIEVVEAAFLTALDQYYGVTPMTQMLPDVSVEKEAMQVTREKEFRALSSAQSYQLYTLTAYSLKAQEDFRQAVSEIQSWQSERIANLAPSLQQGIRVVEMLKDYKELSAEERMQVAGQLLPEIRRIHDLTPRDIERITMDCKTTDEFIDVLETHRGNIRKYNARLEQKRDELSVVFGEAAVGGKVIELKQTLAHTGIQVGNTMGVHQTYNNDMLNQISQLSATMSKLSESVHKLSIVTKLRTMLAEGGIVADLADNALQEALGNKQSAYEFRDASQEDLDNTIEGIYEEIHEAVAPIVSDTHILEQKMIEGRPSGQLLIPILSSEESIP